MSVGLRQQLAFESAAGGRTDILALPLADADRHTRARRPLQSGLPLAVGFSVAVHVLALYAILYLSHARPPMPEKAIAVELVMAEPVAALSSAASPPSAAAPAPVASPSPPAAPPVAAAPAELAPAPVAAAPREASAPVEHRQPPKPRPPAPTRAAVEPNQPATAKIAPSAPPVETAPAPTVQAVAAPPALPPRERQQLVSEYAAEMHRLIAAHRIYPAQSLRLGEQGTVTLRIVLAADGKLIDVRPVTDISARLVTASLQAVRASVPFPPLPASLNATEETFEVPVVYKIE